MSYAKKIPRSEIIEQFGSFSISGELIVKRFIYEIFIMLLKTAF